MHIKKFQEWIRLKENLHLKNLSIPHVSEGEIWWASIGENIGSEINGKSELFSRPVIIFKKLSHDFYLVVPTTTQNRIGTWYVSFKRKGISQTACLHQIRTIDSKRISSRLGELTGADFEKIKINFCKLYTQKIPHPIMGGAAGKSRK